MREAYTIKLRIKKTLYYSLFTILILGFALTKSPLALNLLLAVLLAHIITSSAPENYKLTIFILPSLSLFVEERFSYATLLLLVAFTHYLLSRLKIIRLNKLAAVFVLVLILYDAMHIPLYDSRTMVQTLRWAMLLLYAMMPVLDMNFRVEFESLVWRLVGGVFLSTLGGNVMNSASYELGARFKGFSGDPNGYSMVVLIAALFILNLYEKGEQKKGAYTATFLTLIMVGFTSQSRAYLLSVSLVLFLIIIYSITVRKGRRMRGLLFLALGLGLLSCVAFSHQIGALIAASVHRLTDATNLADMTGGRTYLVSRYWSDFWASSIGTILFGRGVEGYFGFFDIYIFGVKAGCHNTYLEVLLSWGITGIPIFLLFVLSVIRAQFTKSRRETPTFISSLPVLAFAMYLTSLQSLGKYSTYFYLAMILMNLFYGRASGAHDIGNVYKDRCNRSVV